MYLCLAAFFPFGECANITIIFEILVLSLFFFCIAICSLKYSEIVYSFGFPSIHFSGICLSFPDTTGQALKNLALM